MEPAEKCFRPRRVQALKMHLIVTVLGVLAILVCILLRGMYTVFVEETSMAVQMSLALLLVCVIVGAVVLAIDLVKYSKLSPRKITLTAQVFYVELPGGRKCESKWIDIRSAASRDLIWSIVTGDQTIAFSVAGLTYREQDELGQAISRMVARHRRN